jgi:hypothetical protein
MLLSVEEPYTRRRVLTPFLGKALFRQRPSGSVRTKAKTMACLYRTSNPALRGVRDEH